MNIFEVIKEIKREGWYKIPGDENAKSWVHAEGWEATKQLVHFRNYWSRQEIKTEFSISSPEKAMVWNSFTKEYIEQNVITITMKINRL